MSIPLQTYTALQTRMAAYVQQHGFCTPLPPDSCAGLPAGCSFETLHTLLCASHTSLAKRNHRHLLSHQSQRLVRYEQGVPLATLALELRLPPTKVARDLLEGLLAVRRSDVKGLLRCPEGIVRCSLREESAARLGRGGVPAGQLLARLAGEVALCVSADLKDSPLLDCVREWSGEEHEWRLAASLAAAGVPAAALVTEEELRAGGGQRRSTPDILLRWPIVVPCPHSGQQRLVTWVDSKASMGDPLALDDSSMGVGRQVKKYLVDFCPGLVVFWGGWVDALLGVAAGQQFQGGLLLHHRPPQHWRWASAEEKAAVQRFTEAMQGEQLGGEGSAEGGGGGAAAEAPPIAFWEAEPQQAAPVSAAAGAPEAQGGAASSQQQRQAALQQMLAEEMQAHAGMQ
jgi:hypothetical protein